MGLETQPRDGVLKSQGGLLGDPLPPQALSGVTLNKDERGDDPKEEGLKEILVVPPLSKDSDKKRKTYATCAPLLLKFEGIQGSRGLNLVHVKGEDR